MSVAHGYISRLQAWWHRDDDPGEMRTPKGRRSLWALAAVALGLAIARAGLIDAPSTVWFAIGLVLLALAAITRGLTSRLALLICVLALAGGWFTLRIHEVPADSLERWIDPHPLAEPGLARLEGLVEESPRATQPSGSLARFSRVSPSSELMLTVWRAESAEGVWRSASGRVRVRLGGDPGAAPIAPGDVVRLSGRLSPVRPGMNPGEPDWLALARQSHVVATLDVPASELISRGEVTGWEERTHAVIVRALGSLRLAAARSLSGVGPESLRRSSALPGYERLAQSRALLAAMLLGERSPDLAPVSEAFTRLGLLHLVAISGFNLVVMAGVAMFVLRLGGERGWLEPVGVGVLIALYMLVLPLQAPIFRAGAMALVFLIAEAFGRRYDRLTLLGWIAIVALAIRPLDLWAPGFQLSFGVVAGLLVFTDRVNDRIFGPTIRGVIHPTLAPGRVGLRDMLAAVWRWLIRAFKAQASASVVAWVIAAPIIAFHSGLVSPLAILTTLLVLPITVVVLWVGYTALLVGVFLPSASWIMAGVLDGAGVVLVEIVMLLDRAPVGALTLQRLSAALAAALVLTGVYWLWRGRRRDGLAWGLTACAAVWLGVETLIGPRMAVSGAMRVDTLAVGDGACHVLRASGGPFDHPETIMWDCGSLSPSLGERRIPDALRALRVTGLPTVILTHAHFDHYSALPDLVERAGVRRVIVTPQFLRRARAWPQSPAAALVQALSDHSVNIEEASAGDVLTFGACVGRVLWPPADRDFRDPNDESLMIRFEVPTHDGLVRVLMTGDAAREAVPHLLDMPDADATLGAEVLEIPHHGAFLDSAAELVRVSRPSVVLQSTGPARARDERWRPWTVGRVWAVTSVDGAWSTVIARDGEVLSGPATIRVLRR